MRYQPKTTKLLRATKPISQSIASQAKSAENTAPIKRSKSWFISSEPSEASSL